jgi:hypothetical protein
VHSHRGRARGLGGGILEPCQQRHNRLIKAAPFIGERDGARCAIEQPHADAHLEPRDRPADARLGQT